MSGPLRWSRHIFCLGFRDLEGEGPLQLTEREPFLYRPYPDNRMHTVAEGETLFTLAHRAFSPIPRAAGLWWVICDFQPDPIIDPTIALQPAQVLIIPSMRTLTEVIFAETRRRENGV